MRPIAAPRRPVIRGGQNAPRKHKPDYILVLMSILLLVVGLVVVYAISPGLSAQNDVSENYYVLKQLTAIGLGIAAFSVMAFVPYTKWKNLQKPLIGFALVATLIALIMPVSPEYPAHRWIRFGGFSLQSVEIVKMALIVGLAAFLEKRIRQGRVGDFNATLKPLALLLLGTAVVVAFLQKDLGSMVVIAAAVGAMTFVAGLRLKWLAAALLIGLVLLAVFILPFAYRRERLTTFMNPEADCVSSGYQACQALIAVGSGGLFGKGLAYSGQAYGYLPEAANDSIFAVVAEKFGFVGASLLVILFAALFTRIKNIIERAPDDFSKLMVVGILAWLSTQAFINIGAMIGLLPLKGITLPFISYGGTSVVFVTAATGLIFNISRYTSYAANNTTYQERPSNEDTVERRRNRRTHYSNISRRR